MIRYSPLAIAAANVNGPLLSHLWLTERKVNFVRMLLLVKDDEPSSKILNLYYSGFHKLIVILYELKGVKYRIISRIHNAILEKIGNYRFHNSF